MHHQFSYLLPAVAIVTSLVVLIEHTNILGQCMARHRANALRPPFGKSYKNNYRELPQKAFLMCIQAVKGSLWPRDSSAGHVKSRQCKGKL